MQLEHPVISAWRELRPDGAGPERIEDLGKTTRTTTVYRLVRVGKGASTVIAKRCPSSTAVIERTVYEEILPNLPFPMLHYYGYVEESGGEFGWLFLEDVSADKFRRHVEKHRLAAACWLGIMNMSASGVSAAARLPGREPGHYLNLLNSACNAIESNITNPMLSRDDCKLLESIVVHCHHVAANWRPVELVCEEIPHTLVHGDFLSKNVGIRTGGDEIILLPFDWEKAGWGVPAEDISAVDISTYWHTVREFWPHIVLEDFMRLARVGKLFRWLVFLEWIAPHFAEDSVERPLADMRYYANWLLGDLKEAAAWRDKNSVRTT